MNPLPPVTSREILDEDLLIMRATLATLLGDIRLISKQAALAAQSAMIELDRTRQEVAQAGAKS